MGEKVASRVVDFTKTYPVLLPVGWQTLLTEGFCPDIGPQTEKQASHVSEMQNAYKGQEQD
jgi:hypothetical protein